MPSSGHSHSFRAVCIPTDAMRVSTTPPRLTPGPSDLKATSGAGIILMVHPVSLTLLEEDAGSKRDEDERSKAYWEGGTGRRSCTSFRLGRAYFFFSVTACISTHESLCLFMNEITRPEKLFWQMWPRICVRGCETCHEVMCQSPVSVSSWPLPCCHIHRTPKDKLMGYTWSV